MNEIISKLIGGHLVFLSRYQNVVTSYLFTLMIRAPKHTLTWASSISGLDKSQYSRFLSRHSDLAKQSLRELSQNVATEAAIDRPFLIEEAPWTCALIVDATLHGRSTLHTDNSQRFNHGDGFVIGHQWTNVVLIIGEKTIPLPPISFISRKKYKTLGIKYVTEHEKIVDYFSQLNLENWVGAHRPSEILCLFDAGYDDKEIQKVVSKKGWDLIGSLKKCRGSKSIVSPSKKFKRVDILFRDTRRQAPWRTIHINMTVNGKNKRRRYRARQIEGTIKGLKDQKFTLVCSEKTIGKGRIYLVSSNINVSVRQILLAYRVRWGVELFHKDVKSHLGFEDLGTHKFESQEAHVHWVYVAYILLNKMEAKKSSGIKERQEEIWRSFIKNKKITETKTLIQLGSRINEGEKVKNFFKETLINLKSA